MEMIIALKNMHISFLDFDKAEVVNVVLIHYVGDESDFPHGNSKSGMNFYRTCPSVLSKNFNSSDLPGNIYKNCVSKINDCLPEYNPILKPRNTKQIRNYQQKERQKSRLTHDALYVNLHELAYDLSDYIIKINTFPDLVVICGLPTLSNELNQLLMVDSDLPQLLSYDTTFQLGDFYLFFGLCFFHHHLSSLLSF